MDIWSVFKILFRRWYITVPLLLVSGALAMTLPKDVAPSYKAESIVTLQGPTQSQASLPGGVTQNVNVNPLLSNTDNLLSPVAFALQTSQSSATARDAVASAGFSSGYTVTQGTRSSVLSVDAETSSRTLSLNTVGYVVKQLTQDLNARQAAFLKDPTQRVNLVAITPPEIVTVVNSSKIRQQAVIGGVGLAVAVIAALAFEALAIARRRRRGAMAEPAAAHYVNGHDDVRHAPMTGPLHAPNGTQPSHVAPVASPRPIPDASTPPGVPSAFPHGEPVRWEKTRD